MNLRSLSIRTIALVNLLLFAGILVSVMVLAEMHYKRLDLTANRAYTLSDGTVKMLRSLGDVLHIKVYMSKDLPPEFTAAAREIKDTFEEFAAVGGRNVNLRFIDPADDDKLKADLNQMGILELRAQIRKKERLEYKNIYFSAAFFYRNRKEIIRNLYQVGSLELAAARAIYKLIRERTPKIAYVTSAKTYDLNEGYSTLYKELLKTFNFAKVDLDKGEEIPEDADVLFIAGPNEKLSEWAKYQIDRYLTNGGNVVAFVEQVKFPESRDRLVRVNSNLDELVANYGVKVNKDMVCDFLKRGIIRYNYGGQIIQAQYPPLVAVDKVAFSKYPSPITNGLEVLYLPWTSSITLEGKLKDRKDVQYLAVSSPQSTVQTSTFTIDPARLRPIGDKKERVLAVLVPGPFESAYKDKPAPAPPAGAKEETKKKPEASNGGKEGEKEAQEETSAAKEKKKGYLVVVGNAFFASDDCRSMFWQTRVNMKFFQNLFEYLTMGSDLIGIRMKKLSLPKVLEEKLNKSKSLLWAFNIALMPFLLFAFATGFKIWSFMRKRRYEEMVGR